MDITFRPRLTKGRHLTTVDEHGQFCLIEAIGYNADRTADDHHDSVDTLLGMLGRMLNDRMCTHIEADRHGICDACQGRLWAIGERIADTGYATLGMPAADRTALHARLALEAAGAVLSLIDRTDPLHSLVATTIEDAAMCLADPSDTHRADARLSASRVDNRTHSETDLIENANAPHVRAAAAAVHAARAAAAASGDRLDDASSTSYFFANRRAEEAVAEACSAVAGDPAQSMMVARRILNSFGKGTSQKATPGAPHIAGAFVRHGARAALAKSMDVPVEAITSTTDLRAAAEEYSGPVWGGAALDRAIGAELAAAYVEAEAAITGQPVDVVVVHDAAAGRDDEGAAIAAAFTGPVVVNGVWYGSKEAARVSTEEVPDDAAAEFHEDRPKDCRLANMTCPDCGPCEGCEAIAAAMAADLPEGAVVLYGCDERKMIDGVGYPCGELGEHETHKTALGVIWWTPVAGDDGDMDDFDESIVGDVADEAIGDLERAEAVILAVVEEHRPVAVVGHAELTGPDAANMEYHYNVCYVCRDASGRPVPYPCRTSILVQAYRGA